MSRAWTWWNWKDDPEGPKGWPNPESRVTLVEGLSDGALRRLDEAAVAMTSVEQSDAKKGVYVCIETSEVLSAPTVRAPCRPRSPRHIPALRVETGDDLSERAVQALAAVQAPHRALVIQPRRSIDLYRCDSSGRDTDRNWIQYTNILHGFTYAGAYHTVDEAAYTRFPAVDLVVVAGPTGPGAWPIHPDWVRILLKQCQNAKVPFAFLGWGDFIPEQSYPTEINGFTKRRQTWLDQQPKRERLTPLGPYRGAPPLVPEGNEGIWWLPKGAPGREGVITDWGAMDTDGTYVSGWTGWKDSQGFCRVSAEHSGRILDGREYLELPQGL